MQIVTDKDGRAYPATYDMVRYNTKLKDLINRRLREMGYTLHAACEEAGLESKKMHLWLTGRTTLSHSKNCRQLDVIRLCKVLGIEIRLRFVVTPLEEMIVPEKAAYRPISRKKHGTGIYKPGNKLA